MPRVELDHVFLFVSDERTARSMMADAGLRISYSNAHAGQGTRNFCACLDDMFLELVWLDGSTISPESERITLGARGRGRGSPIGVAWRGACDLDCEPYAAPFLPKGATIPVARASFDPTMPFVFRTPGGTRPIDRTDGSAGTRQAPALTTLDRCVVRVPDPGPVATLLADFDRIDVARGQPGLEIDIRAADGTIGRRIVWSAIGAG